MKFLISSLLFVLAAFNPLFAQPDVIKLESFLSVDKIRPGDEFKVGFKVTFLDDWHGNSNTPSEDFLIPTVVSFDSVGGLEFGEVNYPEGEMKSFAFTETPISVYNGKILIWAKVKVSENIELGETKLSGQFSYQACNDVSCLAPTQKQFEVAATIVGPSTVVKKINTEEFKATGSELGELGGERSANQVGDLIAGKGLFFTLGFIFLGGLALNLTPCVYPIIPITISFFVGQSSGKISKSFFLALVYVIGMSITYSALGVVAAMTGGLLGSSLQSPIVLIAIAAIFLLFAASMFGAFEIRVPAFLNKMAGGSRQGALGSLFMGLTVGIVAAPCIGPFVISLLTYVAAQGDPFMGFLMFFVLSLGLGLPFLILGTFSASIKSLPRSGEWMVWVKKVFGVVMIAMAVYFINSLIPEIAYIIGLTATVIIGGLIVGFIDKSTASFGWFKGVKSGVGILMIALGFWVSFSAWAEANTEHVAWQKYDESLVAQAKAAGKPILIDFYADWCIPCKQIEKSLFASPIIVEKSEKFVWLKADLTKENSERVKSMRKKYRVLGVPTIILLDNRGREVKRFTDELVHFEPQEFLGVMNEVMATNGN